MQIREIAEEDAALAGEMIAALLQELTGGEVFDPAPLAKTAAELLRSEDVTGFAALDGSEAGAPIGLVMLNQCAAIYAGGRFGEVTELYVLPEYRSQGVAARLIEACAALGRTRGWQRLEVGAPDQPAWQRTLAFYQHQGFQETGPRLRLLL
ncbi:hypothetical protein RSK20926_20920 [Roseobacter sp. SK209-2-6]|uniref:GNAT family N-acetyltransferase n=1 Tax=Roseobacter sp. SK209-2-6 TaxID=388739 RepID=UPI0000F3E73F|nr:GNAT family N-acetyltransferase [Roseobacter sp. SK209-2-6]EBA16228.1 hypothetical protein RSK20926_20920 [Roseobacter sp. SK209-2-6]